MIELWAIARKIIQEALRMRITLVLLLLVIVLISIFPFTLRHDGSIKGQLQLVLNQSLMLTFVFLTLQSLYLAVHSFTSEIKLKQIFLVDVKPLQRWKFFVGKFLGLSILNGVFLIIVAAAIYTALIFIYFQSTPKQQTKIQKDFFTCYRGVKPMFSQKDFHKLVDKEMERRKKQRMIPPGQSLKDARKEVISILRQQLNMVSFRWRKKWLFEDIPLLLSIDKDAHLRLRYKVLTSGTPKWLEARVNWEIGTGASIYKHKGSRRIAEYHEFTIPTKVIEDNNTVEITFYNYHKGSGIIYFPYKDGIELLYPASSLKVNLLKGVLLIYFILCFLVLLALFAATFLTFPVAMLFVMYILTLGMVAELLLQMVPMGVELMTGEREGFFQKISRTFLPWLFEVIPNFSKYLLIEDISESRIIEWSRVAKGALVLLLFKGGLLTLAGCFIFNRREVAKPLSGI